MFHPVGAGERAPVIRDAADHLQADRQALRAGAAGESHRRAVQQGPHHVHRRVAGGHAAAWRGLRAGAAVVSIEPPLPSDPQGFVRRAVAVRDAIDSCEVRACVIENEGHRIALLAADVTNLDSYFADRVRKAIVAATGIAYENILLNSSHTHAGLWPRKAGEKLHGEFARV